MKLYLNEEYGIDPASVVGIFDMDTATAAAVTREFLTKKEKDGVLTPVTAEIPVSFIVSEERGTLKVLLTRNAPKVLARRTKRAYPVR